MQGGSILMVGQQQFPYITTLGNSEIGGWLFKEILKQIGITEAEFKDLI